MWWATGQSNSANRMKNCSIHCTRCSCVSTKSQTLEAFGASVIAMPGLIVQWPARIFHFYLLHMKLAYCEKGLTQGRRVARIGGDLAVDPSLIQPL